MKSSSVLKSNISRCVVYLPWIFLGVSTVLMYRKVRNFGMISRVASDPLKCNDEALLEWALSQNIKGKVSIGTFVFEDTAG